MTASERSSALEYAARHIFSLGVDDAAAQLCVANMAYGLAKIHHLQRQFGLPTDASFIGSPDMTITRNTARWAAGIGYGGKLCWGDGSAPFIVLDAKANVCGMLVGGLAQRPDLEQTAARIDALGGRKLSLEGIPLSWDFHKGNHFIDVFEVREEERTGLPPYVFVIHGAAPEIRSSSKFGLGLYWDDSPALAQITQTVETPWGPLHILCDTAAEVYWEFNQFALEFSSRRRELAAQEIFGDFQIISNTVHQRLISRNEMLLGCHDCAIDNVLLPVMLRANLPAYLMRGRPNLSDEQIRALGFTERAAELGLEDRLRRANLLPHGAGYTLEGIRRFKRVIEAGPRRYFVMESVASGQEQIISDLHDLAGAQYRGEEVLRRTLECGLGTVAATLQPLYVFKT